MLSLRRALFAASALFLGVGYAVQSSAQSAQAADAGNAGAQSSASQQPALAEVIVTAQRRSQNIQDVPIVVTALSGPQLTGRGITSTEDLAAASPGVSITEYGQSPTFTSISIRGIGPLDLNDDQESPNSIYIDGAYMPFEGGTGLGLFDVNQVEILRGPQGTLFGRNATGGLVQITSNKPTDYFTGDLQVGYGSWNQISIEGALGGPLSSNVDARFAFSYNRQDPYFENTLGPSVGADNTLNGRFQLQFKLTEGTGDLLALFGTRTLPIAAGDYWIFPAAPNPANHGLTEETAGPLFVQNCANLGLTVAPGASDCFGYVGPSNRWRFSDPIVGFFERSLAGVTNTLTHEMSWATLTSVTNYTYYDKRYGEDDSGGPTALFGFTPSVSAFNVSQDLRLNGATRSDHWVTGVYFLTIDGNYSEVTPFGDIHSPSLNDGSLFHEVTWTYALYAQNDYSLTREWTITTGARIEDDRKRIDLLGFCSPDPVTCGAFGLVPTSESVSGNVSNVEWSGNFQLAYKPTDNLMFYGGIRRGTKDAEFNVPITPPPGITLNSLIIRPEILTDTEVGFKSTMFDNRIRLNGDVFHYNYNDYQALKYIGVGAQMFTAQARDYGAELETSAAITKTLTGSLGLAYLHTRVMGVTLPDGSVSNDQQQPQAPEFSVIADLRKEWHVPFGTVFVEGGMTYEGSRYFSTINSPDLQAPSYVTGNASVGYTSADEKWTSTFSVKNINNVAIPTYLYDVSSTAGFGLESFAPPRWFNFRVRYSF
jgi:iron complex outermembrane recepter protein